MEGSWTFLCFDLQDTNSKTTAHTLMPLGNIRLLLNGGQNIHHMAPHTGAGRGMCLGAKGFKSTKQKWHLPQYFNIKTSTNTLFRRTQSWHESLE